MYLHRVTPTWDWTEPFDGRYLGRDSHDYRTTKSGFIEDQEWIIVVNFPRFGGGERRKSDFEVGMRWDDVEKIIEKFREAGRAEAIAIQEARKLTTAAKELGWCAPEPVPQ